MDRKWKLNRSQRMQIKMFVCLLGVLLLLVLAAARIILMLMHREEEEETPSEEPHIPVVEMLPNVWIMEVEEDGLLVFRDGARERYPFWMPSEGEEGEPFAVDASLREQVADVELTDGAVTAVSARTEKINGKILRADDAGIEVEGYGRLPLAADYKGYRLYDSLAMCTVDDLFFGYDFTDLCIENGEVCGVLMVKEGVMEKIRVLLKTADYGGIYHDEPVVSCDVDYTVVYGPYDNLKQENHAAGEELSFGYDSPYFEGGRVRIIPGVLTGRVVLKSSHRSQGTPAYRGELEILQTEDGIIVINEVLLEEYLYSVVPSEMPSTYPAEALKAQAVCARTYAYGRMLRAGYPQYGAHADDSTSYQVYNNISEQETATTAVKETYGQLLYTQAGEPAGTYYYSTSCGVGTDANVWKTEEAPALTYLDAKLLNRTAMAEAAAAMGNAGAEAPVQGAAIENGGAETAGQDATMENGGAETAGQDAATENGGAETAGQGEAVGNGGAETAGQGEAVGNAGTEAAAQDMDIGEMLRGEEAFAAFISERREDDFESGESWYRWSYQVEELDKEHLLETLQKRYAANSKLILTETGGEYVSSDIRELGDIKDLYIEKRGAGGVADELVIETSDQKIKVISEHNIRYILNDGAAKVVRQDGSAVDSPNLLPSGFFVITVAREDGNVVGYTLHGGGFGHGVGMSQNGARQMAGEGYSAMEILLFFYNDCYIENVYE